jgi:predicted cupin superfamily sugar epimerase
LTQSVFKKMRNAEIVRMIDEQHMTKTAVAKWFNISKQRVWQIYSREKLNVQDIRPAGDREDNPPS